MLTPLSPPLHLVLVAPQIPPNTGNVIRLTANTATSLHLVEPLGFAVSSLRRKADAIAAIQAAGGHPSKARGETRVATHAACCSRITTLSSHCTLHCSSKSCAERSEQVVIDGWAERRHTKKQD